MKITEAYKELNVVFGNDARLSNNYQEGFYALLSFCAGILVSMDVTQKELNSLIKKVKKGNK